MPPEISINYLDRGEVTKLLSPRSKNDTELDIKFATRVQEALIAKHKVAITPPKLAMNEPEVSDNASWIRWYRITHECGINAALDAYQLRYNELNGIKHR